MQRFMSIQFVAAAVVLLVCSSASAAPVDGDSWEVRRGGLPQLPFYHKFSPQMKENAEKSGAKWPFPALNTPKYHQLLLLRDLARHGRKLATSQSTLLTFYLGNLTSVLPSDGLQYALINVGTPSVSHFVALDTGSDLFWMPCECKACASPSSPAFQRVPSLNVYDPSKSNTSKAVTCGSTDCSTAFSICQDLSLPTSGQCTYQAVYGSPNTSTSGTIYQDDLHLTPNSGAGTDISAPILLGQWSIIQHHNLPSLCLMHLRVTQTQPGSFNMWTDPNRITGRWFCVPDGLIGLGREPFSVPSVLAKAGLVGDSFSICFSFDGSGRIVFGDFGSSTQTTTPFQTDPSSTYLRYNVQLDSISINNDSIPVNAVTLFDTGTTATFLTSTVYKAVIVSFANHTTKYKRVVFDGVFELCYATGNPNVDVPSIDFNLGGGATFHVLSPFQAYYFQSNNSLAGFCLGFLDGGSTNIFGANSMLGYNLVYDRKSLTLGFEASDCYAATSSPSLSPVGSDAHAPSPRSPTHSPAPSQGSNKPPPEAGPATPLSGGAPTAASPGASTPKGSSPQRTSVSLLSILSLGFLVNFLLC